MHNSQKTEVISKQKQQAIDWLVRLRSDDISDDELYEFADWLAQDHAHSEAFSAAESLFDEMTLGAKYADELEAKENNFDQPVRLLTAKQNQQKKTNNKQQFFYWMKPLLAVAAVWLLVINLFLPQQVSLLNHLTSDYSTQTAELREVKLPDGSKILLNTNSAISVDYDESVRKIILHHGQVHFSVAKDNIRPFFVDVGGLLVQSLGTTFQINKDNSNSITIAVQEHAVSVVGNHRNGVRVQEGQQLSHQLGSTLDQPESIDLMQATAWQQQRLIINDQPLGDLIKELERYRNGRIFLSDKHLEKLRITGVFSLKNTDAVIESICKVLNLKETRVAGWWSVLHR